MIFPHCAEPVSLTGHSLTLESFIAVARFQAKVSIAPEAMEAMQCSRALADRISREKRVAYGITTGFGDFANVAVPEEMSARLSTNLILSHAVGTGEPYSDEQVRGMMLLRANALCIGISGVRPLLVTMLVDMLNRGVIPVIPQKGSLGASGDLAPLSHMGLVLLGRGKAKYNGVIYDGAKAMELAGIPVLDTLVSKEGLGITNGTCAMTSVGALYLYDTLQAAELADIIASVTFTALGGQLDAFQERMHTARGHKGQIKVAKNIRLLTADGEILQKAQRARVQDAYALRCIPQVHGAVRDALAYVRENRRPGQNNAVDALLPEGCDGGCNGKIGFARTGGTDANRNGIFLNGLHIALLAKGLCLDRLSLCGDADHIFCHLSDLFFIPRAYQINQIANLLLVNGLPFGRKGQ